MPKPKSTVRVHAFIDDGIPNHLGVTSCGLCGLLQTHTAHQLPERDRAAAEVEARRLGEKLWEDDQ